MNYVSLENYQSSPYGEWLHGKSTEFLQKMKGFLGYGGIEVNAFRVLCSLSSADDLKIFSWLVTGQAGCEWFKFIASILPDKKFNSYINLELNKCYLAEIELEQVKVFYESAENAFHIGIFRKKYIEESGKPCDGDTEELLKEFVDHTTDIVHELEQSRMLFEENKKSYENQIQEKDRQIHILQEKMKEISNSSDEVFAERLRHQIQELENSVQELRKEKIFYFEQVTELFNNYNELQEQYSELNLKHVELLKEKQNSKEMDFERFLKVMEHQMGDKKKDMETMEEVCISQESECEYETQSIQTRSMVKRLQSFFHGNKKINYEKKTAVELKELLIQRLWAKRVSNDTIEKISEALMKGVQPVFILRMLDNDATEIEMMQGVRFMLYSCGRKEEQNDHELKVQASVTS